MDPVLLTVQRAPTILGELVSCGATLECMSRVGAIPYNISNRVMFDILFVFEDTAFVIE
jgi:hypothetical protein